MSAQARPRGTAPDAAPTDSAARSLAVLKDIRQLRVLLLHPQDQDGDELCAQLQRIGCRYERCWPSPDALPPATDLVLLAVRPENLAAGCPWLGLATLATWLVIAAFFRYSSLAAIVSAVFAPFYQLLIWGGGPVAVAVTVIGLLLVWRHSANIQKLLKGTESRLGQKSAAAAAPVHHAPAHGHSHKHAKNTHRHGGKP